jgi:hypothetical protein
MEVGEGQTVAVAPKGGGGNVGFEVLTVVVINISGI